MVPSVIWVVVLLALLGMTFCVVPVVGYRYGDAAQRAAQEVVEREGLAAEVLARHRVQFKESATEALLPFGIAVVLFVLAGLDLMGVGAARVVTWVVAGVLLTGGGFVTAGQLMAARYTAAAFARSDDPAVRGIDAQAVVEAAAREFPSWLRPLLMVRFLLTTLGSNVVIALLMTPGASAHFR